MGIVQSMYSSNRKFYDLIKFSAKLMKWSRKLHEIAAQLRNIEYTFSHESIVDCTEYIVYNWIGENKQNNMIL